MSRPDILKQLGIWIRKMHIYISLYLLLFMLLFFISGLILNHSNWKFSQFWTKRKESTIERDIQIPDAAGDPAKARDIMRQLDISGEILAINRPEEGQFNFGVHRPGRNIQIRTNLNTGRAIVKEIHVNIWGFLYASHLFTGVRGNQERDWFITRIWSFLMDAVSLGSIFLVISSIYLWHQSKRKKLPGIIILGLGIFLCLFFLFGLNWIN